MNSILDLIKDITYVLLFLVIFIVGIALFYGFVMATIGLFIQKNSIGEEKHG